MLQVQLLYQETAAHQRPLSQGRPLLPGLYREGGAQGEPQDIHGHERHQAAGWEGEKQRADCKMSRGKLTTYLYPTI